MGQMDLYHSDFYEDKGRFADAFNGVLFGGKEVMKPEELEKDDSVMVRIRDKDVGKKVICDKIRKWKGRYVSIMVLENQSYVDYRMVLRVMEAEVIGYDKQRKEANLQNRKDGIELERDEYPSGMKKGQKFIPIITLVLYMGKEQLWDGARSLYEMLEIDESVKPFVNDYKLNLFDYHEWEDFSRFKTENRLLFEALSSAGDKKKLKDVLMGNIGYEKLDEESAKAILGILGMKIDLDTIKKRDEKGKEVYNVCKAVEDYREDGKKEGELMMAQKLVNNLMRKQKISFEEASDILGITKGMQKKLLQLIL